MLLLKLPKKHLIIKNPINQLFLRILNRPATEDEIKRSQSLFAGQIDGDHSQLIKLEAAELEIKDWLHEREEKGMNL